MISAPTTFNFGEDWLTASTALSIASGKTKVALTDSTRKKVNSSWKIVQNIVDKGDPVYGINTGFGVGLKPLELGPKEGLALINGTQFIAAHAVKVVEKLHACLSHADIIGAMMIEGLQGSVKPFFKELHELRPFKGNIHVAQRVKRLLKGSEIMEDHIDCERVQDPYSLRCIPQVHGASRNAWLHLKELLEVELNSVTDNPVIINEEFTISGGNFHGQPLAMALDYACLAASEIGNISDRRIYLSLEGNSPGVPKLLMKDTGINSGYMILQYTTAALASENKGLCFPSSADSIPTSLGQEDHVTAQAFEFRKPMKSGVFLDEIHKEVRKNVPFAEKDRVFANDIEAGIQMIQDKTIIKVIHEIEKKEKISLATQFSDEFEREKNKDERQETRDKRQETN
ncbi:Histidine ammonia-lyase [Nymphon striatum]|nr:Histidine ammonia-lyase [Nymphon striatum]